MAAIAFRRLLLLAIAVPAAWSLKSHQESESAAAARLEISKHNRKVIVGMYRGVLQHVLSKVDHLENEEAAAFRDQLRANHDRIGVDVVPEWPSEAPRPTLVDLEEHLRGVRGHLAAYEPEAFLELGEEASSSPEPAPPRFMRRRSSQERKGVGAGQASPRFKGRRGHMTKKKQKGGRAVQAVSASASGKQLARTGDVQSLLSALFDMIHSTVNLLTQIADFIFNDRVSLSISGGITGSEGAKADFGLGWEMNFGEVPEEELPQTIGKVVSGGQENAKKEKLTENDESPAESGKEAKEKSQGFFAHIFKGLDFLTDCGGMDGNSMVLSIGVSFEVIARPPFMNIDVEAGFNMGAARCLIKLQTGLPAKSPLNLDNLDNGCGSNTKSPWMCALTYPLRAVYKQLYPRGHGQHPWWQSTECTNSVALSIGVYDKLFGSFGYEASLSACGWQVIQDIAFLTKRSGDPDEAGSDPNKAVGPTQADLKKKVAADKAKGGDKSWFQTLHDFVDSPIAACSAIEWVGSIGVDMFPPGVSLGVSFGPAGKIFDCLGQLLIALGKAFGQLFINLAKGLADIGYSATRNTNALADRYTVGGILDRAFMGDSRCPKGRSSKDNEDWSDGCDNTCCEVHTSTTAGTTTWFAVGESTESQNQKQKACLAEYGKVAGARGCEWVSGTVYGHVCRCK